MNINWNNIRAIEGQREGFEELVCQLAGQEEIPNQIQFIRIGKPDGGKECYWELINGDIYCWQAKYFINSLSSNQWKQVDKSVKTTIDNHPDLKKYYISIPVDRPDGKGHGKSMLQKWKEYIIKWEVYALLKQMKVSFEYWGKHELEIRLRKPENEGLIYYFFNGTELTDNWFESRNQECIDALGGRYTPELNMDLPFLEFHDGFTRSQQFTNQINYYYEQILEKRRSIYLSAKQEELKVEITNLDKAIDYFRKIYEDITFTGIQSVPFNSIRSRLESIEQAVKVISNQYSKWLIEIEKANHEELNQTSYSKPYNTEQNELWALSSAIREFYNFMNSAVCALVNNPYLLMIGPAGIGKSHALADIINKRKSSNQTSLLLLGENFSTSELPWTQILRNQLRFDSHEDVLLCALNAKAESQQSRIIFFIDALNEGNGRRVWPKRLKSFIRSFHRFPWLGLIVSIRESFEELIANEEEIDRSIASRIYHPGFEGLEYDASIHFFQYYNITPPGSPLLHPEFQNPLFLKLFCQGLNNRGLNQVPNGYQGISSIIENYLEGIEHKLAQPDVLDYDPKLRLLRKILDEIIQKMVEGEEDHLHYEAAEEIANSILSGKCGSDDKKYLRRLISEGVINEDLYWTEGKQYDGIHFAYQRFQDHLFVSALLDRYFNPSEPIRSFESGPLKELLVNNSKALYNQNLVEALSIQIPERVGKELHEIASYAVNYSAIAYAFIDGLIWRRYDTIDETSLDYVNKVITKNQRLYFSFLEVSVSMATKPDYYFNAARLHNSFFKYSLKTRDKIWTTWLQSKYRDHSGYNSVKRLIDWAWKENGMPEINDESARLAGIMLSWFLTSSNRYLRDGATKALVCLFQNRIPILTEVLKKFEGVNDPYVIERLYAVAYGCALRTQDQNTLVSLSNYIYREVFDVDLVYPNILLRDYARGVIEYTIHINLKPSVEVERIRPPYKSEFPDKLPTVKEIDKKYANIGEIDEFAKANYGSRAILRSMTTEYGRGTGGYGDFGRYTWERAFSNWDIDSTQLSNYGIQRIYELGYDPKVFSDFDSEQPHGRGGEYLERIGKKYQWIVFYEILAKVSDNFKMFDERSHYNNDRKVYSNYDGPWRPYVRDIDPTFTIKKTEKEYSFDKLENLSGWLSYEYNNWEEDAELWKRRFDDFPPIKQLISVTDSNEVEWLNLNMHTSWKEPKKLGDEKWNIKGKRIWYNIGSYIIESKDLHKLLKTNISVDSLRNWYPDVSNRYEVFSREHYWSPASLFFQQNQYYGGDALPKILEDCVSGKEIAIVHDTVLYFMWEKECDCSKVEAISYLKPSPKISIDLKSSENEGEYLNENGDMVCFDPSVYTKGPSCLLIRKDHFMKMLIRSGLNLVWIVLGEKQIRGNNNDHLPKFNHTVGGLYYLDENGFIIGDLNSYISEFD